MGGCLVVIYDILDISAGFLNPFFPIIFAIILALIIKPWYMGVFWASAIWHIIGSPWYIGNLLSSFKSREKYKSTSLNVNKSNQEELERIRKLREEDNNSGTSSILGKFLEQSNKHGEIINKYSEYWKQKGKNIDIKEMYFELSAAGCYHVELILRSEQYIDRYIQLKTEGKTPIEIAYILVKEIDGDK